MFMHMSSLIHASMPFVPLQKAGELPGDPFEDYVDFFTSDVQRMPVTGRPEPKSRFTPSKWEHKKIMKIVRSIRKVCLDVLFEEGCVAAAVVFAVF